MRRAAEGGVVLPHGVRLTTGAVSGPARCPTALLNPADVVAWARTKKPVPSRKDRDRPGIQASGLSPATR